MSVAPTPVKQPPPLKQQPPTPPPQQQIDPRMVELALEGFRSEQNLAGGMVAGFVAALVGAALWAVITVVTEFQIGWMAVGVGFLVRIAVRTVGKGIDKSFAVGGAVLALAGWPLLNPPH